MFLKRFTLVVLSSFLIICLCTAIVGTSLQILLYPQVYEEALDESNIFDYIEGQIMEKGYVPETLFVRTDLNAKLTGLMRKALAYVRGEEQRLDLTMNISMQAFFEARVAMLDTCREGQEPFSSGTVVCRPAITSRDDFLQEVYSSNDIDSSEFSSLNLAEALQLEEQMSRLRDGVVIFRGVILGALALSAFITLMIILLNRRSIIAITEWIDADLLIVCIAMYGASYYIRNRLVLPANLDVLRGFLMYLIQAVLGLMTFYAGILLLIAVAMLLFALVTKILKK